MNRAPPESRRNLTLAAIVALVVFSWALLGAQLYHGLHHHVLLLSAPGHVAHPSESQTRHGGSLHLCADHTHDEAESFCIAQFLHVEFLPPPPRHGALGPERAELPLPHALRSSHWLPAEPLHRLAPKQSPPIG